MVSSRHGPGECNCFSSPTAPARFIPCRAGALTEVKVAFTVAAVLMATVERALRNELRRAGIPEP